MLYLIILQHFPELLVYKRCAVVTYNFVGHSKPYNYIFLDKIFHGSSGGFAKWHGLHPLGKIFCGHKDPDVSVGGGINWSHQVEPPSMEGPRSNHALQVLQMGVDQIGLHLVAMTLHHKLCGIPLHNGPVTAHLQDAPI